MHTHYYLSYYYHAFSALTLLVGRQEGHPDRKKTEWWGAGMVICLERSADLRMAQLMPLPLTVSCFSKILIGFTFLVPAHPGSLEQRAVKWACVCVHYYYHTARSGLVVSASTCGVRNQIRISLRTVVFIMIATVMCSLGHGLRLTTVSRKPCIPSAH